MKNTILFFFAAIPLLLSAADYTPDEKIVYKTVGETELKLHLFKPEGLKASDSRPAIVFFFGGGWVGGNPNQFYQQAEELSQLGLVTFSAEYRVKSRNKTTPFDAVEDAKSAIRWVRAHAAEFGIDPDRIVASGGSAGGHIAGCTGVIVGLEAKGEDLSVSSVPNAMMLYNPVLDTTKKGYGLKQVTEARKTEVSLTHHVRPGIVPTIVFHGTGDTTVPFENAERFTRLMTKAGNRCELKAFEGQGHGFFNSTFFRKKNDAKIYDQIINDTVTFLRSLGYIETSCKDVVPE
ncbi:MAG: alpha/beta hydrolase [Opitutaceae bacterium]